MARATGQLHRWDLGAQSPPEKWFQMDICGLFLEPAHVAFSPYFSFIWGWGPQKALCRNQAEVGLFLPAQGVGNSHEVLGEYHTEKP